MTRLASLLPVLCASAAAIAVAACGMNVTEPIGRSAQAAAGAAGFAGSDALARDLVAYWKLDEAGSDQAALDSASGSHLGTPIGAPVPTSSVAPVQFANPESRSFDGQSQYLLVENSDDLNFSGEITLAAWVYLTALTDGCQYIVAHGYCWDPPGEVALRIGSENCGPGGAPHYWAAGAWLSAEYSATSPISDLDLNTWLHLVGTYDGQLWHLYKNGAEVATNVSAVGAVPVASDWAIGARAQGVPPCMPVPAERFWNGSIDDVRIYRRALAAAEVQELYHL
jgi:hypothetical protein